MATFQLYTDSGLTTPYPGTIPFAQSTDGYLAPVELQMWAGLTDTGRIVQAVSNPGVDYIQVFPADTASGSGFSTSGVKLALTQAGLATATAGAALNLATSISSGTSHAVSFWIRVTSTGGTERVESDVHLRSNDYVISLV